MGWDDIDGIAITSGMVTLDGASVINVEDYLTVLGRAVNEKFQITEPTGRSGVYDEIWPDFDFNGAPVNSTTFTDLFRQLLNMVRSKVNFAWDYGRDTPTAKWYHSTVLTDVDNIDSHEVTQAEFETAMGSPAYLAYITNDPMDVALDTLWTADVINSIQPALSLMQVFEPRVGKDPLGLNNFLYGIVDPWTGYGADVRRFRQPWIDDSGGTWQDAYDLNTNAWEDRSGAWDAGGVPTADFGAKFYSERHLLGATERWEIGRTVFWAGGIDHWSYHDNFHCSYLAKDLNGVVVDMDTTFVLDIGDNFRGPSPYNLKWLTDLPLVNATTGRISVVLDPFSESFNATTGKAQMYSVFGDTAPIPEPNVSSSYSYGEQNYFGAAKDALFVDTNNPALEFYIAP